MEISVHGPLMATPEGADKKDATAWVRVRKAGPHEYADLVIFTPTLEGARGIADAINAAFTMQAD